MATGRPYVDITGQRFARLLVMGYAESTRAERLWLVRCDCGRELKLTAHKLRSGNTRSCGCLRRELVAASMTTHGRSGEPIYQVWSKLVHRCTNANDKDWRYYGGRGITVCDRWRHDFAAFLADMGERPTPQHSIDRIDPDGSYAPENCRWATWHEQRVNRSRASGKVA